MDYGRYNDLRVIAKTNEGFRLDGGNTQVLLPAKSATDDLKVGDTIEVFVYVNKAGQAVATTKDVFAEADSFAFLNVTDVNDDGAYLDLGIDKDVFVPLKKQKHPMEKDKGYTVFVYVDEQSGRLLASSYLANFVETETFDFEEGDEVKVLIAERTPLGYNAIINNRFIGLIYHNEVFANLKIGEKRKAWIKSIRVEGKIDLSLQPQGFSHILDTKEVILLALKENKGVIPLGDKSSPDAIYELFQISKSAFKKAIGGLYKERLITLTDEEIKLVR